MEKLFLTVLGMSGTASVVILMVLLARLALRRAPKVFSYALWAVVLFRLLCPFSVESAFSLAPSIQVKSRDWNNSNLVAFELDQRRVTITVDDAPVVLPEGPESGALAAPGAPGLSRPEAPAASAVSRWSAAGAVWLAGAALLMGYGLLSLWRLRRKLVGSVPLAGEENVRLADHIPSPFVLGLVRPQIYLPSGLPEGERDYILLHERTHIARFDHVTRALAWLALAVHWFNPLVWLAFRLAGRDMEMSCDEAVLGKMGRDVRADYSTSLLRLSAGGRLPAGPLAFGGGDLQGRINNVLRYKKPALWIMAAALMAVMCAGAALATNFSGVQGPPDAGSEELSADLALSLRDNGVFVDIEGTVDGIELDHTGWAAPSWFESYFDDFGYPFGRLGFNIPLCGKSCQLDACWTDESRTAVRVTATPIAMISSYSQAGNLIFTVDVWSGTLLELEGHIPKLAPGAPELVPTEAEAVRAARVAALLLEKAEQFYESSAKPVQAPEPDSSAAVSDPPLADLPLDQPMRLWFGSGAGGWSTTMTLHPDGAFEGEFSDFDLGVGGPGYQSTEYVCQFHGRFGDIRQATAASWSMVLEELTLDTGHPLGEEWIETITADGGGYTVQYNKRCISSAPYGLSRRDSGDADIPLEPGARFMFYAPEASGRPGGELYGMENESSELYEFWTWWPKRYAISEGSGGTLGCYALRNVEAGYGFFDLKSWGITGDS